MCGRWSGCSDPCSTASRRARPRSRGRSPQGSAERGRARGAAGRCGSCRSPSGIGDAGADRPARRPLGGAPELVALPRPAAPGLGCGPASWSRGAGVVLLGALAGWASAPGPHAASSAGCRRRARRSPPRSAPDWRQVLDRARPGPVGRVRSARTSPGSAAVDAPASAAYRYDAAAVCVACERAACTRLGLRLVLESVARRVGHGRGASRLRVTDRLSPYELRDSRRHGW